ncbi:MAG TPA: carboxymuconolactone decarboxylase family protein [Bdellovibrionota bacterium]|nr:carboxymuconolactone decarboxylase family protein [Bdellovibrionota bacterium]
MPHVPAPEGVPGIVGLFATRPETARPMQELVEVLLRGPSPLSRGERELIAAHVSKLNQTRFCEASHSAFAAAQLPEGEALVELVKNDFRTAPISAKLKSLLEIATKVQGDARRVSKQDVEAAKAQGATDVEIHDTVLIAAAFCMYNRYVDGLAAYTPDQPEAYRQMAKIIVEQGYARPIA